MSNSDFLKTLPLLQIPTAIRHWRLEVASHYAEQIEALFQAWDGQTMLTNEEILLCADAMAAYYPTQEGNSANPQEVIRNKWDMAFRHVALDAILAVPNELRESVDSLFMEMKFQFIELAKRSEVLTTDRKVTEPYHLHQRS